jgi:hypothetical protein
MNVHVQLSLTMFGVRPQERLINRNKSGSWNPGEKDKGMQGG